MNIFCVIFNLRPVYLIGDWDANSEKDIQNKPFYGHVWKIFIFPKNIHNLKQNLTSVERF